MAHSRAACQEPGLHFGAWMTPPTPVNDLPPPSTACASAWQARKPDARNAGTTCAPARLLKQAAGEMEWAISADFGHRSRTESRIADG